MHPKPHSPIHLLETLRSFILIIIVFLKCLNQPGSLTNVKTELKCVLTINKIK